MKKNATLPEFDLLNFTPYRLAVAAERTSEELSRQYKAQFGISIPEWRVLVHIAHFENVSVRDIEVRVAMEKSKVSRAASRLESQGFIAKSINECDRRLVSLSLTDKGHQLMQDLLPLAAQYQKEIESRLGALYDGLEAGLAGLMPQHDS